MLSPSESTLNYIRDLNIPDEYTALASNLFKGESYVHRMAGDMIKIYEPRVHIGICVDPINVYKSLSSTWIFSYRTFNCIFL